jgi:hypothetical protein
MPLETWSHTVSYGDTSPRINVAEFVDRKCVGGIRCASQCAHPAPHRCLPRSARKEAHLDDLGLRGSMRVRPIGASSSARDPCGVSPVATATTPSSDTVRDTAAALTLCRRAWSTRMRRMTCADTGKEVGAILPLHPRVAHRGLVHQGGGLQAVPRCPDFTTIDVPGAQLLGHTDGSARRSARRP